MAIDDHIRRGHPITFGLLTLFGIITLAISAWLVSRFNLYHNYRNVSERDRVRFVLFCSCWTVVFSILYGVLFFTMSTSIFVSVFSHIVFLAFTWIMWTAAAAAVTEMLGGGLNCDTQRLFVYCGQLNALEAFCWIMWILVTFTTVVVLIRGILAARRGDGYKGSLVA
ncbi:hypothetical protein EV122DRAFT_220458 [Schizophyllum commune]